MERDDPNQGPVDCMPELPGMYYDQSKRKYFKIMPHHIAPADSPYTKEAVRKRKRSDQTTTRDSRYPNTCSKRSTIRKAFNLEMRLLLRESNMQTKGWDVKSTQARIFATGQLEPTLIETVQRQGQIRSFVYDKYKKSWYITSFEAAKEHSLWSRMMRAAICPWATTYQFPATYSVVNQASPHLAPSAEIFQEYSIASMWGPAPIASGPHGQLFIGHTYMQAYSAIKRDDFPELLPILRGPIDFTSGLHLTLKRHDNAGQVVKFMVESREAEPSANAKPRLAMPRDRSLVILDWLGAFSGSGGFVWDCPYSGTMQLRFSSDVFSCDFFSHDELVVGLRNGQVHFRDLRKLPSGIAKPRRRGRKTLKHSAAVTFVRKLRGPHIIVCGFGGKLSKYNLNLTATNEEGFTKPELTFISVTPEIEHFHRQIDLNEDMDLLVVGTVGFEARLFTLSTGMEITRILVGDYDPQCRILQDPKDQVEYSAGISQLSLVSDVHFPGSCSLVAAVGSKLWEYS